MSSATTKRSNCGACGFAKMALVPKGNYKMPGHEGPYLNQTYRDCHYALSTCAAEMEAYIEHQRKQVVAEVLKKYPTTGIIMLVDTNWTARWRCCSGVQLCNAAIPANSSSVIVFAVFLIANVLRILTH